MIGHLGSRVSALLDGQLPPEETERAWEHVHACHACRDLVEREGWVKTRLAGLSHGSAGAPEHLKGSLLGGPSRMVPPGEAYLALAQREVAGTGHRSRRTAGLVAIGGGALGAAVMGVVALGVAPADAPSIDRRAPLTQLVRPTETARLATPRVAPRVSGSVRGSVGVSPLVGPAHPSRTP